MYKISIPKPCWKKQSLIAWRELFLSDIIRQTNWKKAVMRTTRSWVMKGFKVTTRILIVPTSKVVTTAAQKTWTNWDASITIQAAAFWTSFDFWVLFKSSPILNILQYSNQKWPSHEWLWPGCLIPRKVLYGVAQRPFLPQLPFPL